MVLIRYIQQRPLSCETSSSMVGPKNQDFCPKINTLKGNKVCFKKTDTLYIGLPPLSVLIFGQKS